MNLDNARAFLATCEVSPLWHVTKALIDELEEATPVRVVELEQQVTELQDGLAKAQKAAADLALELEDSRTLGLALLPNLSHVESELTIAKRRVVDLEAERDGLRGSIAPLSYELNELKGKVRQLEKERETLQESLKDLKRRYDSMCGAHYQLEQEVARLR